MNLGLQHIRVRKRVGKKLEPFPSKNVARRSFDYLMYTVGVIQPVALLPQIIAVYADHHTEGVSLETWSLLTLFNALWAMYGIVHRDKLIAIANILLTILDLAIVFGVLYYH